MCRCRRGQRLGASVAAGHHVLRALGQMLAETGRFSDPLEWRGRLFDRAVAAAATGDTEACRRELRAGADPDSADGSLTAR